MRFLSLAALLVSAPTLASAADYLPPPPAGRLPGPAGDFNWEGLYGGIHVGLVSGDFGASTLGRDLSKMAYKDYAVAPKTTDLLHFEESSRQTAGFGGFFGHNWAFDDAIVGIEAEYMHPRSKLQGQSSYSYSYNIPMSATDNWDVAATATARAEVTDYGVFKLRGGYAMGRFLPYASIGLAVGRASVTGALNGAIRQNVLDTTVTPNVWVSSATVPISAYINKTGYVTGLALGLGLDYAPIDNVFVRAQYQYVGFADFKGQRATLNTVSVGAGVKY